MRSTGIKSSTISPHIISLEPAKDIGIPNSYPFKEQVVEEVIQERKMAEKEKKEKREKSSKRMDDKDDGIDEIKVGKIIIGVNERKRTPRPAAEIKKSRKELIEEMKEVMKNSEVVVLVLDARDPLECRIKAVESKGKVILVLNKADLVPE